jgi:hypothetical protein
MENPKTWDPSWLRVLADAITKGGPDLQPIESDFFAIDDGRIVGCCALGSALITLDPSLLERRDHHIEFGKTETPSGEHLTNLLKGSFPILRDAEFTAPFLAKFVDLVSQDEIDGMSESPLFCAIAFIHDETRAGRARIAGALCEVADGLAGCPQADQSSSKTSIDQEGPLRDFVVVVGVDVPAFATLYVQGTCYRDALAKTEVASQELPADAFEANPSEFRNRLRVVSICDTENDTLNVDQAIAGNIVRNQRTDAESHAYQLVACILEKHATGLLAIPSDLLEKLKVLQLELKELDAPGGSVSVQQWAAMLSEYQVEH